MSHPLNCHVALALAAVRRPDGRTILPPVTLAFGDERTGVVGANGSGKSTLARLVAGRIAPSSGAVVRHGRVGFLPQDATHRAGDSVAEVLGIAETLAALDRLLAGAGTGDDVVTVADDWDVRERATEVLRRLGMGGLDLERSLGEVSGGEGTRLALAALVLRAPDLLVLDEPTNHLDAGARRAVYELLDDWPGGLVVVSHDRRALSRVDRVLELSSLGARLYGGGYSAYLAQRDVERAAAERALDAARASLRRAAADVQAARERKARQDARGKRSRGDGSQPSIVLNARRERSQTSGGRLAADGDRILDAHRDRLRDARTQVEERTALAFTFPPTGLHAAKRVLQATHVAFAHDLAAPPVVRALDLTITGAERIAVAGGNGSGKSTVLRLLAGTLAPQAGTVSLGVPADRVGVVDQHVTWPLPGGSLLDNMLAHAVHADAGAARQALAAFRFRGDAVLQPVATLSGGETIRGALAARLHAPEPPLLLLLDEPTNHLDLDGVLAVERALARYDGALVVVSHDPDFLRAIGITRVLRRDASARWR